MIYLASAVKDGMTLATSENVRLAIHNPRWWRLDRWVFWAWLWMIGRPRGVVSVSAVDGGVVQRRVFRAYEVES